MPLKTNKYVFLKVLQHGTRTCFRTFFPMSVFFWKVKTKWEMLWNIFRLSVLFCLHCGNLVVNSDNVIFIKMNGYQSIHVHYMLSPIHFILLETDQSYFLLYNIRVNIRLKHWHCVSLFIAFNIGMLCLIVQWYFYHCLSGLNCCLTCAQN